MALRSILAATSLPIPLPGIAVSLAMTVRSRLFWRTISSIRRSGVPTAMKPPIMRLGPFGIMATEFSRETVCMCPAPFGSFGNATLAPLAGRESAQLDATLFGELAQDVWAGDDGRSRLKIELRRVVGFDYVLHHLLGGRHDLLGRKEPQFAHGCVERNELRRVLDRGVLQRVDECVRRRVDEFDEYRLGGRAPGSAAGFRPHGAAITGGLRPTGGGRGPRPQKRAT